MADYISWTHTKEELETYSDKIKVCVISKLVDDELISVEDADEWTKTHTIILKKQSMIKRFLSKLTKKVEDESYSILVAEVNDLFEDKDDNSTPNLIPLNGGKLNNDDEESS